MPSEGFRRRSHFGEKKNTRHERALPFWAKRLDRQAPRSPEGSFAAKLAKPL
jgi:hypothetical protein